MNSIPEPGVLAGASPGPAASIIKTVSAFVKLFLKLFSLGADSYFRTYCTLRAGHPSDCLSGPLCI